MPCSHSRPKKLRAYYQDAFSERNQNALISSMALTTHSNTSLFLSQRKTSRISSSQWLFMKPDSFPHISRFSVCETLLSRVSAKSISYRSCGRSGPCFYPLKAAASADGFSDEQSFHNEEEFVEDGISGRHSKWRFRGSLEKLQRAFEVVWSVLPGGSWWRVGNSVEGDAKKSVTVFFALRKMWDLVSDDRWVIIGGFASVIVAAASEISIPNFLTATIFSAQNGPTSIFQKNVQLLILMCCTFGIFRRMREKLYSALLFQDISFFDMETVGDLTSRLGSDCQQVSRVIGNDLNLISRNVLQGTGAFIYLVTLSWPLALSTLMICSVILTIMFFYSKYQKNAAKTFQEFLASANEVSQETFSLMRIIRSYGTEKQEIERYVGVLKKLADISLRQSIAYGLWSLSFNSLYHAAQVVAVLIGGASIMAGHITVEQLTKFILYADWLIYSTWWVGDNWSNLMQSVGASEKVFRLMDLLPSEQFLLNGLKLPQVVGHIEFVDLSFCYPSREKVGLSGSGKSTLVNLLLRLYEPTSGQSQAQMSYFDLRCFPVSGKNLAQYPRTLIRISHSPSILIDGFPLSELDIKWFRENIGFVGQEPRLFRMDISSNIRYGCTREVSHEDVERAAKQAYAHHFISSLPNGYETLVDDGLLSGGQKQRIAIARAILRNPAILILDEATSALDAESEHHVQGALYAAMKGPETKRTVIVIAHRLSTIRAADRIIVMDGGHIVEMGEHSELLGMNGIYARLTRRQVDALV
ncbi:hypothetical protein AMTRI_Chr06g197380 [Amborella trichopoda]